MIKIELNKENLEKFQNKLKSLSLFREEWRVKQSELENSNAELLQKIDHLSDDLNEQKEVFKSLAKGEFVQTKEKKLIGGLGIRVGVELLYEEEKAFDWAKEHKLCLQLNKGEFEKIAKSQDVGFVEKTEKITVTFPKEIKFD